MCVCVFFQIKRTLRVLRLTKKKKKCSFHSNLSYWQRENRQKKIRENKKKKKKERGFYSLHASHLETAVLLFFFVCVSELDFHVRFEAVHAPSERRKR